METRSKRNSRLPSKINFGNTVINSSLAFLSTKSIIAIVDQFNIKNKNLIILPKRNVKSISELNETESIDMFLFAQKISKVLEKEILKDKKSHVELVIRDGEGAGNLSGQACLRLIPRKSGERVTFDEEEKEEYDVNREFKVKEFARKMRALVKKEINSN